MVISICCAPQCLGSLAWAPVILSGIKIASDCFKTSVLVTKRNAEKTVTIEMRTITLKTSLVLRFREVEGGWKSGLHLNSKVIYIKFF